MGASRNFSGSSEYFRLVATPPVTAYPFTMGGWFRAVGTGNQGIISIGSSTSHFWSLNAQMGAGGDPLRFKSRAGGGARSADVGTISNNVWYHGIARAVSSTDRWAYLDGTGGQNTQASSPNTPDQMAIGAETQTSLNFNGQLAHLALWNVALDVAEIQALATGLLPYHMRPDALVGYWPLTGSTPGQDFSVSAHDLTETGTTDEDSQGPPVWAPVNQLASVSTQEPPAPPALAANQQLQSFF